MLTASQHVALSMVIADMRIELANQEARIATLTKERDALQAQIDKRRKRRSTSGARRTNKEPA